MEPLVICRHGLKSSTCDICRIEKRIRALEVPNDTERLDFLFEYMQAIYLGAPFYKTLPTNTREAIDKAIEKVSYEQGELDGF